MTETNTQAHLGGAIQMGMLRLFLLQKIMFANHLPWSTELIFHSIKYQIWLKCLTKTNTQAHLGRATQMGVLRLFLLQKMYVC